MKKNIKTLSSIFFLVVVFSLSYFVNNSKNISPPAPKAVDSLLVSRGVTGDLIADTIIGQPDFSEGNMRERVANHVFDPGGVYVDKSVRPNRVYVADSGNSRVLAYRSLGTCSNSSTTKCTDDSDCTGGATCNLIANKNADAVIGQIDFSHGACNGDASYTSYPNPALATNSSLCFMPQSQISPGEGGQFISMATDPVNHNLYLPDALNNRVLMFKDPLGAVSGGAGDKVADAVWGQVDFTQNKCNKGRPDDGNSASQDSLCIATEFTSAFTSGVDIDASRNLWVTDTLNRRVLRYPYNSTLGRPADLPDLVLGQPNFTVNTANTSSSPSIVNKFFDPGAVKVHPDGTVFVADTYYIHVDGDINGANNRGRILKFTAPFSSGMNGLFWGDYNNQFNLPTGIDFWKEPSTNAWTVWVSDTLNHSVEQWNYAGTQLLNILYKNDFVYGTEWLGPDCSSTGICYQNDTRGSIGLTSNGSVLLSSAISGNQDVIYYKYPIRKNVPGGMVTSSDFRLYPPLNPAYEYLPNYNSLTGRSFGSPIGVEAIGNQLIVADNYRLMYWDNASTISNFSSATKVIGGDGDFGSGEPYGTIRADKSGHLYVIHQNTIEIFNLPLSPTSVPYKIIGENYLPSGTHFHIKDLNGNDVNVLQNNHNDPNSDNMPGGLFPAADGSYLWVAHEDSNRVFRIRNPLSTNPQIDAILGQPNSTSENCNLNNDYTNLSPTASTLCLPSAVKMDNLGNLYVTDMGGEDGDNGNKRLLKFNLSKIPINNTSMIYAPAADNILLNGQGSLEPAFDPSDPTGKRIVIGYNPYIYANSKHSIEYFNDIISSGTPSGIFNDYIVYPISMDFDENGNLYVSDLNRFRVIKYKVPFGVPPTPTKVPIVAPSNLTVTNTETLRPIFNWDQVPGATSYNLKAFGVTCSGTPLVTSLSIKSVPYIPITDLIAIKNKTICWQVQAVSATGVSAYITAPTTFIGANPPSVPVLSTVSPLALSTVNNPTFAWSAATTVPPIAGITYDLQVDDNIDFSSPYIDNPNITTLSIVSPKPLSFATTYYFRVRSKNPNGGYYSSWTAGRMFKVSYAAPTLTAITNPAILRTKFDWSDVTGTGMTGYIIQASIYPTFAAPFISVSVPLASGSEYTPLTDVVPRAKTIYWRVYTIGAATGYGPISAPSLTSNFISANPPNIPTVVVYPLNAATTIIYDNYHPAFQWKAPPSTTIAPVAGVPTKYDFEIKEKTSFTIADSNPIFADSGFAATSTIAGGVQSYVLSATTLKPNTIYFWRVRSVDNSGQKSYWSPVWTFKEGISSPIGLSIIDTNTLRPTFTWNSVEGASRYTLKVFTNAVGTCTGTPIVTATVLNLTSPTVNYTHTVDLAATVRGKPVCWQVQSGSILYGSSLFTTAPAFIGANPPGIPLLVAPSPLDKAINIVGPLVSFKWNPVAATTTSPAAVGYQIQISENDPSFLTTIDSSTQNGMLTYTTIKASKSSTMYYWRVRSKTGMATKDGNFSFWVTRSFKTK